MDIFALGSTAIITFGIVWAISLFIKLDSRFKFGLSVVIAVAVSFIPADLGNEIMNRVKDGVGIATALAGFYQMMSKTAEKMA